MSKVNTCFVDANVFLRFFTSDDELQHEQASVLFAEASAGNIALVTGPPVLFELCWTLKSAYGVSRDKILQVLASLLGMSGLQMVDSDLVERAITTAQRSGQDFADAYIHEQCLAARADSVATFNKRHFQKMGARLYDFK